jgi:hypothetical protein
MKVPAKNIQVETSKDGTDTSFGIGSLNIIFDILRNKLYSDVIGSIAREYMCNARDAHREVGKFNLPIEVYLPHTFDSNYRIVDKGPGINPDRMNNIFVNYAASTKREDNIQTGFFGIGSKAGFSYTNQFSIITTTPSSPSPLSHVKRHYIAFIDETEVGKIRLVREEPTTEPCGTEIVIAVEKKDYQAFINATINATRFWETKPILKGLSELPKYENSNPSVLLGEGTDWKIYSKTKSNYSDKEAIFDNNLPYAIIDGIPYKIDSFSLSNKSNDDYAYSSNQSNWQYLLNFPLRLYFNIGDLTLSASRESLQYDDRTQNLIISKLKEVQAVLSEQFVNQLKLKDNYVDAVEFYDEFQRNFGSLIPKDFNPEWNGNKIYGNHIYFTLSYDPFHNAKIHNFSYETSYRSGDKVLKCREVTHLNISKNCFTFYNDVDVDKISRSRIRQFLKDNHGSVQLITSKHHGLDSNKFINELKSFVSPLITKPNNFSYRDQPNVSFDLNLLEPKLLSSIEIEKIIKPKKPRVIKKTVKVFKLDPGYLGYKKKTDKNWRPTEIDSLKEGYYVILTGNKEISSGEFKNITTDDLNKISNFLDDKVEIFGVKEQYLKKISKNLKPLYNVAKSLFDSKIKNLNENEILELHNKEKELSFYDFFNDSYYKTELYPILEKNKKNINKNSPLFKLMELKHEKNKIYGDNISLISVMKLFYNNEKIEKAKKKLINEVFCLNKEIKRRYPLIKHLIIDYNKINFVVKDMIDYINLIEEKEK